MIDPRALERLLDHAVRAGIPGISAALAARGKLVWEGTAGLADVTAGKPVRADMLFGIGSITKSLVATAILRLLEERCLSLEETAAGVLGDAADGIANATEATIAQLLNHTTGIPSWENDPAWIRAGRGSELDAPRIWGKSDALAYIRGCPAIAPPGAKFSYSNTNYTLLGMIIEARTGRSVMEVIRRQILHRHALKEVYLEGFEPLPRGRLPRRYHVASPEFRQRAGISPHFREVQPARIDVTPANLSVEWTAGGLLATARDLASFGSLLRNGELLDAHSTRLMVSWRGVTPGLGAGYGLFRTQSTQHPAIVGHDGGVLGFTASLYWLEETDAVVALLCNLGSVHSGRAAEQATLVAKAADFIEAVRVFGC